MIEQHQSTQQMGVRQRSLRHHCRMGRVTELVIVLVTGTMLVIGAQANAQTCSGEGQAGFDQCVSDANQANANDTVNITVGGTAGNVVLSSDLALPGAADGIQLNFVAQTGSRGSMFVDQGANLAIGDGANVDFTGNTDLRVVNAAGQSGSMAMNGGTLRFSNPDFTANRFSIFSVGLGDTASFTQSAGDVFLEQSAFQLGVTGGNGTYDLSGGNFSISGVSTVIIGSSGGTGTVNVTGNAQFVTDTNIGGVNLHLGRTGGTGSIVQDGADSLVSINTLNQVAEVGATGGQGTYDLRAGTFNLSGLPGIVFGLDADATGLFLQSGGSFTADVGTPVVIGQDGTGIYNLSGGSSTMNGGLQLATGAGSGTVNQTGGVNVIDGTGLTFGSGIGAYNLNGGILTLNDISGGSTTLSTLNLGGGTLNASGGFSADATFATNLIAASTIQVNAADNLIWNSNISGEGALAKTGSGILTFGGDNTYTGDTNILGGTLQASAENALSALSAYTIDTTSVLDIGSFNQTIGSLSGAAGANVTTAELFGGGLLTAGSNNASTTYAGSISGSGALAKTGDGILTLAGANVHTGGTFVDQGQLYVIGSIVGDVTVQNAALRIGNSDSIDGTITATEATIMYDDGVNEASSIIVDTDIIRLYVDGNDAATQSGMIGEFNTPSAIEKIGTGTLRLSALNSNTGSTTVSAGTLAISGGAAINDAGVVSVELGAILLALDSERIGSLTNRGTVDLSGRNGTPDTVLTVMGNYTAASDLILDVVLEDDSSASDKLVVNGATSGTTNVFVNNVGGTGKQTVTGILVVDVGDTANSTGNFLLANPSYTIASTGDAVIVAGAYGYALRQFDGDWFLQSALVNPMPEPGPQPQPEPTDPPRMYQPAAPIYEALPSALFGLNQAGHLSQRLQSRIMLSGGNGVGVTPSSESPVAISSRGAMNNAFGMTGAWLQLEGEEMDAMPDVSTTKVSMEQSAWRLRGGVDAIVHEGVNGTWVAGINLLTGASDVVVTSAAGDGIISTDASGVGLAATYYGHNGFYTDAQLQYSSFESDLSSSVLGGLVTDLAGEGRLATIEVGQELFLSNGMMLVPQAQLTWSDVSFDSFTGPNAETVSVGKADSLQLRLGIAAQKLWAVGSGDQARLYGIANVTHEMQGGTSVLVDGTELVTSTPDWIGEVGLGGSYDWSNTGGTNTSFFGEVSALRALSGDEMSGLSGSVGLRIQW